MLDARIPDEVALMVLAHLEDPCDVLRVRQTCCRALRLSQGKQLWELVLRRSPHDRARRWCSLVLDGVPPSHLVRPELGVLELLRYFGQRKRGLVACLRPHSRSDRMATSLAEVLMSREFMTGWLLGLKLSDVDPVSAALAKLPSQFVYDLLLFPLLEAHLARTSSGANRYWSADMAFSDRGSVAIRLLAFWLTDHLRVPVSERFLPLLSATDLFEGQMELDPARHPDPAEVLRNQERLQRACTATVEMIKSLEFPPEVRLLWSHLRSCVRRLRRATHEQASSALLENESNEEDDKVGLLAVTTIAISFVGFRIFGSREVLRPLSHQKRCNLELMAKMLLLLVNRPAAPAGTPWLAKTPHWACMSEWLEANETSLADVFARSTILDEEVVELRSAMTREDWAAQPDDDTRFQQEHADLLDNHMRAYALQCLKSGDDGPDQHPLWLRQRMDYLFAQNEQPRDDGHQVGR